ncbi:MAG: hypothetical protein CEE40_03815 [Chloroflexi bacterium B3_Chlor]|nr:MAG: hypothetical protein CEE40_03815 [Chloroflexi bacterium B3_Chlor]
MPDRFSDSGVEITVRAFQWDNGDWTTDGYTEVSDAGDAGGSGHGMIVNNVNLDFDFCCTVTELTLRFGEYGGNLNMDINGIFKNFENFADIDGSNFDGVTVTVTDGLGNDTGTLKLSGPITSFALGGQELVIDEICYGDCAPAPEVVECVDFEDLPLGTQYHVPERFTDSGVEITVRAFQWDNGDWTTDGFAEVSDTWDAGGSGHGMIVNNVNLDFDFCCTVSELTLKFGEYGGNLNIDVNGIFKNFENFADIDGSNFDGVTVTVTDGLGNDTGTLTLSGPITSFALGGQELVIDEICYGECAPAPEVVECVDFEDPPLAQQYFIFDRFNDSGVEITVAAFQWGDGRWTTDGYTHVTEQGLAGGSGQEMWINNVNLDFDFCCTVREVTLKFGEYGGNLNIDVNGIFKNFDNFADMDGSNFDGVTVTVTDGLGNDTGTLTLSGPITSFALGGQELVIDDVCYGECAPAPLPPSPTPFAEHSCSFETFPDGTPVTGDTKDTQGIVWQRLEGDEFAECGFLVASAPVTSCVAVRTNYYSSPHNYLALITGLGCVNARRIEITFLEPVQEVCLEFSGASTHYVMEVYDEDAGLLGTSIELAEFDEEGSLFTTTFSSDTANISRTSFGVYSESITAVVAIREIRYAR